MFDPRERTLLAAFEFEELEDEALLFPRRRFPIGSSAGGSFELLDMDKLGTETLIAAEGVELRSF